MTAAEEDMSMPRKFWRNTQLRTTGAACEISKAKVPAFWKVKPSIETP